MLQSKAKVFSMSIGYNMQAETPDAFTQAMFNRIKAAGALVVAAAGNGAWGAPRTPAVDCRQYCRQDCRPLLVTNIE